MLGEEEGEDESSWFGSILHTPGHVAIIKEFPVCSSALSLGKSTLQKWLEKEEEAEDEKTMTRTTPTTATTKTKTTTTKATTTRRTMVAKMMMATTPMTMRKTQWWAGSKYLAFHRAPGFSFPMMSVACGTSPP